MEEKRKQEEKRKEEDRKEKEKAAASTASAGDKDKKRDKVPGPKDTKKKSDGRSDENIESEIQSLESAK